MDTTGANIHRYLGKPPRIICKPAKKFLFNHSLNHVCFSVFHLLILTEGWKVVEDLKYEILDPKENGYK